MDFIKLEDYGTIISTEEYIVDKRNGAIANFAYTANNKITDHTDGLFEVTSDLYGDEDGLKYYTRIKAKMKNQDKFVDINFKTPSIIAIDKYINYVNKMIEKDDSLPARTYRYDNSSIKTEDGYSILISYGHTDIAIGPIDKNSEVLVDGNQVIVSCDNKVSAIYIFYNGGYRIIEINDDGTFNSLTNIVFSSSSKYKEIELSKFEQNSSILSNIPNLSILPTHLEDGDILDLEYDEYGIVNKSSGNNILYEKCYFEDGITDTVMSLHPLYSDMLDASRSYNYRIYCLDQLDYNYDDRFAKYTRQLCKVDEDKLITLKENIKNGENSDHPVLEMVSIELSKENEGKWLKNM